MNDDERTRRFIRNVNIGMIVLVVETIVLLLVLYWPS